MRSRLPLLLLPAMLEFSVRAVSLAADLERIEPDAATGISSAVVLPESWGLVQTTQLLPIGKDGALSGGDHAASQFEAVLGNLQEVLTASGSNLSRLVRLHIFVVNDDVAAAMRKSLATRFAELPKPAATFVITALPHPGALVAIDAVAGTDQPPLDGRLKPVRVAGVPLTEGAAHAVVTPAGPLVFISGQAEAGTLPEATRKTMQSLHESLKFLGLDASHVVQVKTFLRPMTEAAAVDKEIAAFYPGQSRPPVTHVEWTYSAPIEIEMVAIGRKSAAPPADPVKYLAPPPLKQSPVFSRIAITEGSALVFVSGLAGKPGTSGEEQNQLVFDRLSSILKLAKSDFRHMAKATYYVSDDGASNALNTIRPKLYDPQRPPAASKAGVRGVAASGAGLVLDMIATQTRNP